MKKLNAILGVMLAVALLFGLCGSETLRTVFGIVLMGVGLWIMFVGVLLALIAGGHVAESELTPVEPEAAWVK